jgi:hypothetical protein
MTTSANSKKKIKKSFQNNCHGLKRKKKFFTSNTHSHFTLELKNPHLFFFYICIMYYDEVKMGF